MNLVRVLFSRQFIVFVIGGLLSAFVDVGLMMLMLRAEFGTVGATTAGFAFGLAVNYIFHIRVTFASCNNFSALIRFLIIVGVNYVITLTFVLGAQFLGANIVLAKIASLPVVAVNGFFFSKFWVFR